VGKHESNVAAFNMIDGLLGCLNLLFVCLLICLMLVLTMVLRSQLNCAWKCCDATTWKTPWGGGGKAEGWRDSTINNETNKAYSGKWPLSKDSISRLINKWETRWDSKDDLQTKNTKTKKQWKTTGHYWSLQSRNAQQITLNFHLCKNQLRPNLFLYLFVNLCWNCCAWFGGLARNLTCSLTLDKSTATTKQINATRDMIIKRISLCGIWSMIQS
jgi:hypothetical protein